MSPAVKSLLLRLLMLAFPAWPLALTAVGDDSASKDFVVKVWGTDDGLTEGSVTDVAQTPEGYLWVGTLFGSVLRFDGTRFVSYNSAKTPEFSQKWGVPRFTVDRSGTLWISMHDGGVTTWDQHGFRSIFTSTNQPDRMIWSASNQIVFVYGDGKLESGQKHGEQWDWQTFAPPAALPQGQHCADADGNIWYLRSDHEIGIWNIANNQPLPPVPGPEGQRIRVLTADSRGQIWIGTDKMLARWETNHFEPMTPTNGETNLSVRRIIPSGTTNLWVEANGKLCRYASHQWFAQCDAWNTESLSKRGFIRFIHGDREGGLWAGAGDLGLIHIAPDGACSRLTTRDGLPSNTIHFAYEDHDGDIWTGYERGGLVQIRRRQFRNIGFEEGLADSLINSVSEDAHGAVWIGTHSGIVGRYENGVCTNITLPGPARAQDSCAAADAQGRVWIGAQDAGLLLFDGEQMQPVATQDELQGYPRLLLPEKDGGLWVGTLWSIIHVTNANTHLDSPFKAQLNFAYTSQAVGGHPTALAEAADGTIWAGTLDGFLMRWDGRHFVPLEPPDRNSLGRIWALWPAPDGSLWAGTEQGGLLHWHDGQFFRYTTQNGLPSDSIVQILGDAEGNLWLGTRAGIARILNPAVSQFEDGKLNQLPVSVYGQSDGLRTIGSAIIYQPNCWHGRDGSLFFAMANSVAEVNPARVHVNPLPPSVVLEELRADDQTVWPRRAGAVLVANYGSPPGSPAPKSVVVGPGRGDLEFRFTGLSLGSPQRVRFKYQLAGLENSWNDAGTERSAGYRHVPPGSYTFRVISYNSDSVSSGRGDLLTVEVRPHFYQTAWFRGGAVLFSILVLSLITATIIRTRLHRRMEQLERQHALERERTRIAQDLHDDLGAGLTEVGLLGGLLQDPARLAARKNEALERIVQRCHDMVVALDEIAWAVNPRNDSVNSAISYLARYAQSFLEPSAIRCRLEMREAEPDHPLNSEQRHNLFLAFKEALNNVAKHSGAGEAHIKIVCAPENILSISIEDNGRGLPAAIRSGAAGLDNLHQRMTQAGGTCEITNVPSGGVAVHLSLPFETHKR